MSLAVMDNHDDANCSGCPACSERHADMLRRVAAETAAWWRFEMCHRIPGFGLNPICAPTRGAEENDMDERTRRALEAHRRAGGVIDGPAELSDAELFRLNIGIDHLGWGAPRLAAQTSAHPSEPSGSVGLGDSAAPGGADQGTVQRGASRDRRPGTQEGGPMTTDIHVLSAQMSLQAALAAEGDLLMIPAPAVRNEAIRRRHVAELAYVRAERRQPGRGAHGPGAGHRLRHGGRGRHSVPRPRAAGTGSVDDRGLVSSAVSSSSGSDGSRARFRRRGLLRRRRVRRWRSPRHGPQQLGRHSTRG